ncbi:hypothetical protein Tco_0593813 [Tanacetum coccineum]
MKVLVCLGAITVKRLAIWPRIVEADLQMLTTTNATTTIIIRREMVAMSAELKDIGFVCFFGAINKKQLFNCEAESCAGATILALPVGSEDLHRILRHFKEGVLERGCVDGNRGKTEARITIENIKIEYVGRNVVENAIIQKGQLGWKVEPLADGPYASMD